METATLTLRDFLLARIAEDEDLVRHAPDFDEDVDSVRGPGWGSRQCQVCGHTGWDGSEVVTEDAWYDHAELHHRRTRVLAECEAKRELAKRHRPTDERNRWCAYCAGTDNAEYPCETSRLLALPYADHPDYRDEWRL